MQIRSCYDADVDWRNHISSDPDICHGKPCITGTRVMVSVILDCLAAEMTPEQIMNDYPSVTKSGILAALTYSSELAQGRILAA